MASQATYYHIRVGTTVIVDNDMYYPNIDYWVDEDYYNTKQTADGSAFKDACLSAQQEIHTSGF